MSKCKFLWKALLSLVKYCRYMTFWRQQTGNGPPERSLVWQMMETDWATLGQCSSVQQTRLTHEEPSWTRTSGLLQPRWKWSNGSGQASDWSSPSKKHVGNSSITSHTPVGWCWSPSSSTGRSLLIHENGLPFRLVPHMQYAVFRWIRAVPGPARSMPKFSTVAAADWKCCPWCVRGWNPTGWTSACSHHTSRKHFGHTGNHLRQPLPVCCRHGENIRKWLGGPQAAPIHRENSCGIRGTTSDNHLRFAAATMESTRCGRDHPRNTIWLRRRGRKQKQRIMASLACHYISPEMPVKGDISMIWGWMDLSSLNSNRRKTCIGL